MIPSRSREIYPPHLLAQKLNNRASFLITSGDYDEGIKILTRALKLEEEKIPKAKGRKSCNCYYCSLESCLNIEESSFVSLMDSERNEYDLDKNQHAAHFGYENDDMDCELQLQPQEPRPSPTTPCGVQEGVWYVYRRPFLVNKRTTEEGHYMGETLFLIILLNLALAHHLKAISADGIDYKSLSVSLLSSTNMKILQKSLQLYELAYQLHADHADHAEQQSTPRETTNDHYNTGSLRFTMIISNNLAEIHRIAGNFSKQKMCLDHLLSAIICMLHLQLQSCGMSGFLQNITPIVLTSVCASAA